MALCRACVCLALGIATAGCNSVTAVRLDIAAPGVEVVALHLDVAWDGTSRVTTGLPKEGGAPKLPGSVLVVLPDMDKQVDITLTAIDSTGSELRQTSSVTVHTHKEAADRMMLPTPAEADLAGAADLSQPIVQPDLSGDDLAGLDFSG